MSADPGGRPVAGSRPAAAVALGVAAVLGTAHAAVSLYWALGGTALVRTLGQRMVVEFADRTWLLLPVVVVKLVLALVPLWWVWRDRPARAPVRVLAWLSAAVLVGWGGLNTLVGNLVLTGVVQPAGGYDHAAMVGHAWLWDPLFLCWGVALLCGLYATRRVGAAP